MTDDTNPPVATPEPVVADPKLMAGDGTTSSRSETVNATAPVVTTVSALPIEHKETFWEKAKIDIEEAITWLKAELAKI